MTTTTPTVPTIAVTETDRGDRIEYAITVRRGDGTPQRLDYERSRAIAEQSAAWFRGCLADAYQAGRDDDAREQDARVTMARYELARLADNAARRGVDIRHHLDADKFFAGDPDTVTNERAALIAETNAAAMQQALAILAECLPSR